ncbi:hypothetical protein RO3G_04698 [Rhizopus delemar RA 99-880]|uniref:Uncharacterized protein n=1 Tax=Rhizopus delemar (strain RA 99-880 / ATCC MYA-4621 / FGSC 9543 / NRRL 43880) TaxID=246409 RepID=I1BUW3_RHIO9|nr:hypothetical protein RO3G_04698 [Rhizopus delemar RA 99-880]|eukprot:EIE79993.1 hypothetical protein RO3G_04698 [Rhizopus delemar RA 99-880]
MDGKSFIDPLVDSPKKGLLVTGASKSSLLYSRS